MKAKNKIFKCRRTNFSWKWNLCCFLMQRSSIHFISRLISKNRKLAINLEKLWWKIMVLQKIIFLESFLNLSTRPNTSLIALSSTKGFVYAHKHQLKHPFSLNLFHISNYHFKVTSKNHINVNKTSWYL